MNVRHHAVLLGMPVVGLGLAAMALAWQASPAPKPSAALFEYDVTAPFDVKKRGVEQREGIRSSFALPASPRSCAGTRRGTASIRMPLAIASSG